MGEFWEPTAQMFGSLFEKPKMSGKLLSKPPFYYILDIIQETLKVTGYPKGLYSQEEFDRQYYVTKDQKLHFLQKIIVLTEMTLEEKIIAIPTRILAGLEPELTNHFLQAVYRAAMSGNDFNSYIEKSQKQKEITAKNQGVDFMEGKYSYLSLQERQFQEKTD